MAEIGSIVCGKYELLKQVGQGGMSKVYLALDKHLNKQWAVKEITRQAWDAKNEAVVQSAIAEAELLKKLDHPSLPRIVDIQQNADVIYVVMDYIEGVSLNKTLEEYGAQSQDVVIEWAKELCAVLGYLHAQNPPIIYRDMKPGNVMLKPNGHVKLIDFGIAREYKQHNIADTTCMGTKGYAAPEQFGGQGQTDERTDIYCLGVTLYHLVTGKNPAEPPYEIYPIRYWNAQLSSGFEAIILKCTQLNPDDRYQSCEELQYALEHFEEIDDDYRKRQRKKILGFALCCVMTILLAGVGLIGLKMSQKMNDDTYEENIQQAEKAVSISDRIDHYSAAIDCKPDELEAYFGLVDALREDLVFTNEENLTLQKALNSNVTLLQERGHYSELAFEIGKLYWYYYGEIDDEYGEGDTQRYKKSVPWFQDVITYGDTTSAQYQMASVYSEIGSFYDEVERRRLEGADAGMYRILWDDITSLMSLTSADTNGNEIVTLELYRLAINIIEVYPRRLKQDGVTKTDIDQVYDEVVKKLDGIEVGTDDNEVLYQIKGYIQDRLADTLIAYQSVFDEQEVTQ